MANADKNFDEYFKNKLIKHEVKPSGLAWERLDQKLSEENKKTGFPFLKIAATILLLISAGYVFFAINLNENSSTNQLANQVEVVVEDKIEDLPPIVLEPEIETREEKVELKEKITKPIENKQPVRNPLPSRNLVAEATAPIQTSEPESLPLAEIQIPELNINEAIALNSPEIEEDEEVAYKVTIISRGIKEEPAKQNLLEEIEEKVDKIGGLFSKVEQGFADLQDAKNNLFANSNPRKERSR